MSAVLNMPRNLDAARDENVAGAFLGGFFLNQRIDCNSGHVSTMRELTLQAIDEAASASTIPLDELLAMARAQADKSVAGV